MREFMRGIFPGSIMIRQTVFICVKAEMNFSIGALIMRDRVGIRELIMRLVKSIVRIRHDIFTPDGIFRHRLRSAVQALVRQKIGGADHHVPIGDALMPWLRLFIRKRQIQQRIHVIENFCLEMQLLPKLRILVIGFFHEENELWGVA